MSWLQDCAHPSKVVCARQRHASPHSPVAAARGISSNEYFTGRYGKGASEPPAGFQRENVFIHADENVLSAGIVVNRRHKGWCGFPHAWCGAHFLQVIRFEKT